MTGKALQSVRTREWDSINPLLPPFVVSAEDGSHPMNDALNPTRHPFSRP